MGFVIRERIRFRYPPERGAPRDGLSRTISMPGRSFRVSRMASTSSPAAA